MPLRLPILDRVPLPLQPRELLAALEHQVARQDLSQGYLRAETDAGSLLLFLRKGNTYCAGALDTDGRPRSLSVRELIEELGHGATAAWLCATDLPLFLCTAVLVRKAPAAQLPGKLLDSETLLRFLAETGRDAVLVVRRGDARSMVFCEKGSPVRLYPAEAETFPEDDDITDRLVGYVYAHQVANVAIDVYDEISLRSSSDAGGPLSKLLIPAPAPPRDRPVAADPSVLAVRLGDRVVFHHRVRDATTIGRGLDNDLELDNPSVSRQHARVTRDGNQLMVEDLGSQNGVIVNGKRVKRAALSPGDEMTIGKYTLAYLRYVPAKLMPPRPSSLRSPIAANEQTFSFPVGDRAMLVSETGDAHSIRGLTFVIGKSAKADLRLRGRGIADEHVRIIRTPEGTYRAEAGSKKKPFELDGQAVTSAELASGDELGVGRQTFRFILATNTPLPARRR